MMKLYNCFLTWKTKCNILQIPTDLPEPDVTAWKSQMLASSYTFLGSAQVIEVIIIDSN